MNIHRKPEWLRKKINPAAHGAMDELLGELRLHTVCQEARCPNITECFRERQATFLILGAECTRLCSFCNVTKGEPLPPDPDEPARVAQAVVRLSLAHVVITSPTRDDLPDGGAGHYAATVAAIGRVAPATAVELLVPDFLGNRSALADVVAAAPRIIGHNVETVPRLYAIRAGADYGRSLAVLRTLRELAPECATKSGLMLGLGETEEEVLAVMADLRRVDCTYLSLGQYLAPSRFHHPVREFVLPETFDRLKDLAERMGFRHVESGPYVRSSYHAAGYGGGARTDQPVASGYLSDQEGVSAQ
ncbi:lipoyl synthase [Geobacter sulfurreducens]|uniref:lipoyl synthase n=1 Tax=Geobacter sulfurreducens TaxID=35554 RepID=UPI000DBB88EC|nr:lipoyl synthase [Geobacter sulfurreducens]BBA68922.1 Lipoyl synthase [Geobacter sulfurreducens]